MDAQRIEVLHVAHGDAVVVSVAHHFVFYFLPSLQRLLHQYLRGESKGFLSLHLQFLIIIAEAGTQSSQGIGCTKYYGVTQLMGSSLHILHGAASFTFDGLHSNLIQTLDKEVPVFSINDGLHRCAQNLYTVFFENAFLV